MIIICMYAYIYTSKVEIYDFEFINRSIKTKVIIVHKTVPGHIHEG